MNEYRVNFIPALEKGGEAFCMDGLTAEQANKVKDAIADYTLLLHRRQLMGDYSNMAWIEVFEDGEWVECDE